jgi:rod shape-determining protein MreD
MKITNCILVIIAGAVLQVSLMDYFRFFRVSPDLLLICVIMVSMHTHAGWALGLSFLCGFLKDSFGIFPAGVYTVLFPLTASITFTLSRKITIDTGLFGVLFTFIAAFACNLCIRIALGFWGIFIGWGVLLRLLVFDPLYTSVFFFLVCRLLRPLFRPVSARSYL